MYVIMGGAKGSFAGMMRRNFGGAERSRSFLLIIQQISSMNKPPNEQQNIHRRDKKFGTLLPP